MMTGTMVSPIFWVLALNALQNSMMFTPCWPRAGPTGGAGFAFPAGTCSLIFAVISFAIAKLPIYTIVGFRISSFECYLSFSRSTCRNSSSTGVDLPKMLTITVSLPCDGFTSSTVPMKLLNGPSITRTRSPFWYAFFGLFEDMLHFLLGERRGVGAAAHETRHLGCVFHDMPRVVVKVHFHKDVAGEEFPL